MSKIFEESPYPLGKAKIPGRRGRAVHVATLFRWALKGVNGVVLETCLVGGVRMTSDAAIARFVEALNPNTVPSPRTTSERDRAVAEAERELDKAGF